MADRQPLRGAAARFALAALLSLAAAPAGAEETTACLLIGGRLVYSAEIVAEATDRGARPQRYDGAAADSIVAALKSRDVAAMIMFPEGERGSLIAFPMAGAVWVYLMEAGCMRARAIVAPQDWNSALRVALGEGT